jgi:hypothetical protein
MTVQDAHDPTYLRDGVPKPARAVALFGPELPGWCRALFVWDQFYLAFLLLANLEVKQLLGYDLQPSPLVTASIGKLTTRITVGNQGDSRTIQFPPKTAPDNAARAKAIVTELTRKE